MGVHPGCAEGPINLSVCCEVRVEMLKCLLIATLFRWEDPIEGVFRIVESEKLARLWGARKNNEKMTYEKLSRAMRYINRSHSLSPSSFQNLLRKANTGTCSKNWSLSKKVGVQIRPRRPWLGKC